MNKDWKKIKKGWIRIHVILSIVGAIPFSIGLSLEMRMNGPLQVVLVWLILSSVFLAIYWALLFITRFLITWIKEGFKED